MRLGRRSKYTRHPFYGTRKMVIFLNTAGHTVNRKRVQRLMRKMGLAAVMARGRTPAVRTLSTRFIPICCVVFP